MSSKGWLHTAKFAFQLVIASIVTVAWAPAQTALMLEGRPTVQCVSPRGKWSITIGDRGGTTTFEVPVYGGGMRTSSWGPGTLYISPGRIAYQSEKKSHDFDESREAVTWTSNMTVVNTVAGVIIDVTSMHERYKLFALVGKDSKGRSEYDWFDSFPVCAKLVDLAFSDFRVAEAEFNNLTGHLIPPSRRAALRDAWVKSQPELSAWRFANPKPPLDPEADRNWILAENAFKERDFASAASRYEDALKIQPLWPTGWFNLALIYAEQKNYADATDCMKHYLELVPSAPDAKDAREKMIIWEDKAKR